MKGPINNFYHFSTLTFSILALIASWFDPKVILILQKPINSTFLILPFAFLLLSVISEIYGIKRANKAILIAIAFILFNFCYEKIAQYLPGSPGATLNNLHYSQFVSREAQFFYAFTISFLASTSVNAFLTAKLTIFTRDKNKPFLRIVIISIFTLWIYGFLLNLLRY